MSGTNTFAELAKNAKSRLNKRGEFREKNKSMSLRAEKNYLATSSLHDEKEEKLFREKVIEIEKSGDVLTPLKHLIDQKIFNKLNEFEKQKYVLKLSNRFLKIKNQLAEEEV